MIQLQAAGTNSVETVHDQIIERRGEQDISIRPGKRHVGGAAQCFALPVVGKPLQMS